MSFKLRFLFASRPFITGQVLGIVYRVISMHLVKKAGYSKKAARTGAVTLIQRFGRSGAPGSDHLSHRGEPPGRAQSVRLKSLLLAPCKHWRPVNPMITLVQQAKYPDSPCMRVCRPGRMNVRTGASVSIHCPTWM